MEDVGIFQPMTRRPFGNNPLLWRVVGISNKFRARAKSALEGPPEKIIAQAVHIFSPNAFCSRGAEVKTK